jgi:hypothetical protein
LKPFSRQDAKERSGDGRERAENALGVVITVVFPPRQPTCVELIRDVHPLREVAAIREREQRPVSAEQRNEHHQ